MKALQTGLLITAFLTINLTLKAQNDFINWVEVKGGSFSIGEDQLSINEFFMSATEVTFDQYDAFCKVTGKENPDDKGWGRGNRPVMHVSWYDAIEFCRWLSQETGTKVRLPSQDEWLFAALGGNKSKGYLYSGSDNWQEVSWFERNSEDKTQPVGTKNPNELGLYDMSGNLWEWCADWSENDGKNGREIRCVRGNSFDNHPSDPRKSTVCIEADARHYNIGFRVVMMKQ